jgi:phosphoglycolate phosphatase
MRTCVIFDLDGTLIDSQQDLVIAVNYMRECYSLPPLPFDEVIKYIGNGVKLLVSRALTGTGLPQEKAVTVMLDYYYTHSLNHTTLYPGVQDGLKLLHNASIPMAVITNKPQSATEKILEGLHISQYFSMIVGGDGNFPLKPDPAALLCFIENVGAEAEFSWMVGDHYTDLEAARRAGMQRCFAKYGIGEHRDESFEFKVETFLEFVYLCLEQREIKAICP